MPINYEVSDNGSIVYATACGTFNAEESISYQRSVAEDSSVKSGYKMLFDTTHIEEIDITDDDIEEIADITLSNPKNSRNMKVAILANTMIVFEICRFYEKLLSDNKNVNIFNSLSTAKNWLGVS